MADQPQNADQPQAPAQPTTPTNDQPVQQPHLDQEGSQSTGSNPALPDANLDQLHSDSPFVTTPEGTVGRNDNTANGVYDNQLGQAAQEEAGLEQSGHPPTKQQ